MGGLPVKPKLQGYVQQELFDEFERYRTAHNLSQSRALEKLLAEFFGKPSAPTLPPHDVVSAFPLVAALRSELLELKIELTHRLQILEDRLAIDSAVEPAASLNGLANVSVNESALSLNESALSLTETAIELNESASISANKSASRLTDSAVDATGLAEVPAVESAELINVPIYSGTTTPAEPTVSAANLEDESAVAENVSAISSVDGLATPLAESVASSADESVGEPAVEEAVEVALAVGSLPVAASEPSVEEVIAATKPQHLNRQQLGKYFGKSHETIRQWEESGRLAEKGWEVVPRSGGSPKNPRLYRPILD